MKKKKLTLKKITVSNLSEDLAKRIYGGEMPTYQGGEPTGCSVSCTDNNCVCTTTQPEGATCMSEGCPSGPESPTCTNPGEGCGTGQVCPSLHSPCFSEADCSATDCTNVQQGCQPTFHDMSCQNGPATCGC